MPFEYIDETDQVETEQPKPLGKTWFEYPEFPSEELGLESIRKKPRETARTGVFKEISQPSAAFARGALETATAGLSEAAAVRSGFAKQYEPESPQFTNPDWYAVGETLGAAIPLGRIAKGATTATAVAGKGVIAAKEAIKRIFSGMSKTGARIGSIYGAGSGVAEEMKEEKPEVGEAVAKAIPGAIFGAATGYTIPAIAGKVAASRLSRLGKEIKSLGRLADIMNPTSRGEVSAWIRTRDSGEATRALRTIRAGGKAENLGEFVALAARAEKTLGQKIDAIAELDPLAKIDTGKIVWTALKRSKEFPVEGKGGTIFSYVAKNFGKPLTLKQAIVRQRQLNAELINHLKDADWNETAAQANPLYVAKDLVRRELSKMIDTEMKFLTGSNVNPYRDWGNVHNIHVLLQKRNADLSTASDVATGRGMIWRSIEAARGGRADRGAVARPIISEIIGPEINRINRQVKTLFGSVAPLSEKEIGLSAEAAESLARRKGFLSVREHMERITGGAEEVPAVEKPFISTPSFKAFSKEMKRQAGGVEAIAKRLAEQAQAAKAAKPITRGTGAQRAAMRERVKKIIAEELEKKQKEKILKKAEKRMIPKTVMEKRLKEPEVELKPETQQLIKQRIDELRRATEEQMTREFEAAQAIRKEKFVKALAELAKAKKIEKRPARRK